jgi:3-phosphoshikimate 1-carboxyvinyltransferase
VPRGGPAEQPLELFVGNAGTAARFLAALVCLGSGAYRLHGVPRMHERPQAALFQALRELGYRVDSPNDRLPATIYGGADMERGSVSRSASENQDATGNSKRIVPGEAAAGHRPALRSCTVSIEESSQFASALLLCSTTGGWDVRVVGENAEESPYVAMTAKLIEAFPQRGGTFPIEPDASSGSYFLAAHWLAGAGLPGATGSHPPAGRIHVRNWPRTDWQIDARYGNGQEWPLRLSRKTDLGDSIMTAIAVAPLGVASRCFTDLGRLRLQECERVVALRTELTRCGAKVVEESDTLTVWPSALHGAEIETYNDHRMAMCFAILGLKVPGIRLKNPACVKKTFPNFFQKLAAPPPGGLGAAVLDAKSGRRLAVDELFAE